MDFRLGELSTVFFGLPPFLPFSRDADAFLSLLIEPRATAAGFLGMFFVVRPITFSIFTGFHNVSDNTLLVCRKLTVFLWMVRTLLVSLISTLTERVAVKLPTFAITALSTTVPQTDMFASHIICCFHT